MWQYLIDFYYNVDNKDNEKKFELDEAKSKQKWAPKEKTYY